PFFQCLTQRQWLQSNHFPDAQTPFANPEARRHPECGRGRPACRHEAVLPVDHRSAHRRKSPRLWKAWLVPAASRRPQMLLLPACWRESPEFRQAAWPALTRGFAVLPGKWPAFAESELRARRDPRPDTTVEWLRARPMSFCPAETPASAGRARFV